MSTKAISRLQISDSGFVFDPQTGSTFSLNQTGLKVIALLRDGKTREQAAAQLAKDYSMEAAAALSDVDDFLLSLKTFGLA